MCRMLSISGNVNHPEIIDIFQKFQQLARFGHINKESNKGHNNGWGIAAYKKGQLIILEKSYENAYNDLKYKKVIMFQKKQLPDTIITHLRRCSSNSKNIDNVHPFVYKNYSFCQNGTIFDSEKIFLKTRFKKFIKGKTDSEKLFFHILQDLNNHKNSTPEALRTSIKKAIVYIRKNFNFNAINLIFSNGIHTWILREINEKNKTEEKRKLLNYYSLFIGLNDTYRITCSEKLPLKNTKWKTIKNHELLEINSETNEIKNYIIN